MMPFNITAIIFFICLDITVKGSILLILGLSLDRFHQSAAKRYGLWLSLFVSLIIMSIFSTTTWRFQIPSVVKLKALSSSPPSKINPEKNQVFHFPKLPSQQELMPSLSVPISSKQRIDTTPFSKGNAWPLWVQNLITLIVWLWLAGCIIWVAFILVGNQIFGKMLKLEPIDPKDSWYPSLKRTQAAHKMQKMPPTFISPRISTPLIWGLIRPHLVLPAKSDFWQEAHRDMVLRHEWIHLTRRDPLFKVGSYLAITPLWFHPLAWIALGRTTALQEQSCDDAVLLHGIKGWAYAQTLLEYSRSTPHGANRVASPGVGVEGLKARLKCILKPDLPRQFLTTRVISKWCCLLIPISLLLSSAHLLSQKQPPALPHSINNMSSVPNIFQIEPQSSLKPGYLETEAPIAERLRNVSWLRVQKKPIAIAGLLLFAKDPVRSVQLAALHGLREFQDSRCLEVFLNLANNENPAIRLLAIQGLRNYQDPRCVEVFANHLNDPSTDFRILALHALSDQKGSNLLDFLSESISDSDKSVRLLSLQILRSLNNPDSVTLFKSVVTDKDPTIRQYAKDSLQILETPQSQH